MENLNCNSSFFRLKFSAKCSSSGALPFGGGISANAGLFSEKTWILVCLISFQTHAQKKKFSFSSGGGGVGMCLIASCVLDVCAALCVKSGSYRFDGSD